MTIYPQYCKCWLYMYNSTDYKQLPSYKMTIPWDAANQMAH